MCEREMKLAIYRSPLTDSVSESSIVTAPPDATRGAYSHCLAL